MLVWLNRSKLGLARSIQHRAVNRPSYTEQHRHSGVACGLRPCCGLPSLLRTLHLDVLLHTFRVLLICVQLRAIWILDWVRGIVLRMHHICNFHGLCSPQLLQRLLLVSLFVRWVSDVGLLSLSSDATLHPYSRRNLCWWQVVAYGLDVVAPKDIGIQEQGRLDCSCWYSMSDLCVACPR